MRIFLACLLFLGIAGFMVLIITTPGVCSEFKNQKLAEQWAATLFPDTTIKVLCSEGVDMQNHVDCMLRTKNQLYSMRCPVNKRCTRSTVCIDLKHIPLP